MRHLLPLVMLVGCTADAENRGTVVPPAADAQMGGTAPDFTLPAADGGDIVLSDHAGDVILLSLSGFT